MTLDVTGRSMIGGNDSQERKPGSSPSRNRPRSSNVSDPVRLQASRSRDQPPQPQLGSTAQPHSTSQQAGLQRFIRPRRRDPKAGRAQGSQHDGAASQPHDGAASQQTSTSQQAGLQRLTRPRRRDPNGLRQQASAQGSQPHEGAASQPHDGAASQQVSTAQQPWLWNRWRIRPPSAGRQRTGSQHETSQQTGSQAGSQPQLPPNRPAFALPAPTRQQTPAISERANFFMTELLESIETGTNHWRAAGKPRDSGNLCRSCSPTQIRFSLDGELNFTGVIVDPFRRH